MFNKPQDAAASTSTAERRLHARRHDISLAYVEIGESNGGIVLNISEGGLVLTAAQPLQDDSLLLMRFQLPGSTHWIEATGKIAWISESKREAGVRFVDISEDGRHRIRNWAPPEVAPFKSQREITRGLGETKENTSFPASEISAAVNPEPLTKSPPPDVNVPDSTSAPGAAAPSLDTHRSTTRSAAPPDRPAASDNLPRAENPLPNPERRTHPRRRDISLAYIDLGGDNGGIILNISEGGLVLAAAAPLYGDRLPAMRFQLPETVHWIEASGEIAWISESKKEAGVRFLALKDEDRERIRTWVASDSASRESQRPANSAREKSGRLLEMPSPRTTVSATPPQPAPLEVVVPENPNPAPASASAREPFSAMASAGAAAAAIPGTVLPDRAATSPAAKVADPPIQVVVQRRGWANIAGIVALASAVSFAAGWFAAGPATRNQLLHMFDRSPVDASGPAAGAGKTASAPSPQQTIPNANAVAAPPRAATPDLGSAGSKVSPPANAIERSSPEVTANARSSTPDKPRVEQPRTNDARPGAPTGGSQSPAENASARRPNGISETSKQAAPAKTTPNVSQSEVARPAASPATPSATTSSATQPTATPSAAAATEPPEIFKGAVTVSFSPYPSIRVPAELKSQMARGGASLQIGRLSSRVDPEYPAEAEQQRIEGAVKVHAIIGRDGAVQSVALISGTPLLAQAVTNAILQWKYQPASIGGQAVAAEEDVVVVFKIVKQTSRSN